MTPMQTLGYLAVAGLLGIVGQGIRVCLGLKKLSDQAVNSEADMPDLFDARRLLISLLIGALAAILASIVLIDHSQELNSNLLLEFAAAGYSGSDFIEGAMLSRARK